MTGISSPGALVTTLPLTPDMGQVGTVIDPQPLIRSGRNWTRWAGPLVSLMILVVALDQFRGLDFARMGALMPVSISFWSIFLLYYFAAPASEWIIFRRLWKIPAGGFAALVRKLVSNEILLGYLGEVYFYAWARRNARITTAPFGALKDVTILSALAGNVVTLAMVALAFPVFNGLDIGPRRWEILLSVGFVLGTSLIAMLLGKRLFTLPHAELWRVTLIHLLRILGTTLLAAVMWHMVLPSVDLSWWLLLGTLRQLLSRLPFLPNKDVVFAGITAFLTGSGNDIASAMALMASLLLAAHLLFGILLGAADLLREGRTR